MGRMSSCLAVFFVCVSITRSQDAALKYGPQPGTVLSGPFDAFVINGKVAAGRQHCLICENALNPAVLVFAREPEADKDAALGELLKKLDDAVERHKQAYLGGFLVFLSPDARSSVTEPASEDIDKLLEETKKRNDLYARLEERAKPLKYLVVAAYPAEGPKGYNIDPKAEVTVVFYQKLKVTANWAFAAEKMTAMDVDAIVKKLDETLTAPAKKKKQ